MSLDITILLLSEHTITLRKTSKICETAKPIRKYTAFMFEWYTKWAAGFNY